MRLIIAEKPSLARAIAEALPGPRRRVGAAIECGDGNVVAWCAGHILQTAPPEAYSPEYKRWSLHHLPITPKKWKLNVSAADLLKSIKTLLKTADRVVHAGDPDREGQLLVDEVLEHLKYKGPVDRILIRDLSPAAVSRALQSLEPNSKYRSLYQSALARQRADWLYGMNMTRLYTLLGQAAGYRGVLSVGRVQTPLLGLIVERDRAIESFVPVDFFVLAATLRTEDGTSFRALWQPGPTARPHLDEEKRLLKREIADAVRLRVLGQRGVVKKSTRDKKAEPPPLPYSLSDLQIDAGRRLRMSAKSVLDACQSLYETHRLITYPRSDCSYLPEGHFAEAANVLAATRKHAPDLGVLVEGTNQAIRTKAWDDKKVSAHHAIIPAPNLASNGSAARLSGNERAVYDLIARRYIAQFYTHFEYTQSRLEMVIAGETFWAQGRLVTNPGWKKVLADVVEQGAPAKAPSAVATAPAALPRVPALAEGDSVTAAAVDVDARKTQPPKHFTDATLIQAMCNVARFVTDPNVKKLLSDVDGIGTPATRAAIIETLFTRGYVARVGQSIVSTATGRSLIKSLPTVATTPDMTAVWESAMRAIHDGTQSLDTFLSGVDKQLTQLIDQGRSQGHIRVQS